MKALSIHQPWAWLICNGWKNIENREWRTNLRGRIAVHASKTMTREEYEGCQSFIAVMGLSYIELPAFDDFDLGGIVGCTKIVDCVTSHTSDWFGGSYGFVLGDSYPVPFVKCRGYQKFFEIDANMVPFNRSIHDRA